MNQLETVKLAAKSWIRKPKGFRIRCSQFVDGARVEQLMPDETQPLLDSDVLGWRLAIKLSEARGKTEDGLPRYTDITLVDDRGKAVDYYATGKPCLLNSSSDLVA